MRVKLDTPNTAMPKELLDQVNVNNTLELGKQINKTGVNSLLLVEASTATNFTSTSYVIPLNMEGVITSSGGWIDINFKMPMELSGAIVTKAQLLLDDEIVDFEQLTTPGFSTVQHLRYGAPLEAGRHTVKVLFAVGSGTAALCANSSITRLQVREILL